MSDEAVRLLEDDIDAFVRHNLPGTPGNRRTRDILLRDPIWGQVKFSPWEWDLIDTPLFRRIKWLHQTSLLYLVFIGANHTRLDHSIGVVAGAEAMLQAIEANSTIGPLTSADHLSVRLAALLHDVGHTVFSHLGERQLVAHPWIKMLRETNIMYRAPKVHELLSALIIRSRAFRDFFDSVVDAHAHLEPALRAVQLEEVAGYILGHATPERRFLAEIINGPFDADKLDYLQRDSYYTGLRSAGPDIDRLVRNCTRAFVDGDSTCHLAVHVNAVPVLEQILFSKLQFTTCAVEHHTVRAANAVFNKYFDHLRANEGQVPDAERFDTPSAFLRRTDAEWLHQEKEVKELASLSDRLLVRNLPKRVLVISAAAMQSQDEFEHLQQAIKSPGYVAYLEQAILSTVAAYSRGHTLTVRDVFVDLPPVPSLGDSQNIIVIAQDGTPSPLRNVISFQKLVTSFAMHSWKGYVFATSTEPAQLLKMAEAATEVFAAEGFRLTAAALINKS